jgi:hypothetical protein
MPRVTHVKSARKDNPAVSKGESYFWWKFRYGGKHYSRTRPRQSQLTQSAYFGTLYGLSEMIEDYELSSSDDLESLVEDIRGQIEELLEETQGSLENMPESLQYSPTGELLQERIDALEGVDGELDYVDEFEFEEDDFDEDGYDTKEEMEEDRAEHESQEETRKEEEFSTWSDEAKSTLDEAVSNAIV